MKRIFYLLLILCTVCTGKVLAQTTEPIAGLPYKIMNASGMALSRLDVNCVIATPSDTDENQLWTFEPAADAGYYYLHNQGTQNYVFLGTANTWDLTFDTSLPSDVAKAEFTLAALDDTNVSIQLKSNGKFLGTDATTDGSWVYADKAVSSNGSWYLVASSSDAQAAYNAMYKQTSDFLDASFGDKYEEIAQAFGDSLINIDETYNNIDDDAYKAGVDALSKLKSEMTTINKALAAMDAKLTQINSLLNNTAYPGVDALTNKKEEYEDSSSLTIDQAKNAEADLAAAIKAYVASQTASESEPADFTLLIQHPWFCNDANTPASNSVEDIAAAGLSATVENSTGWTVGSTATGGDQRLNYTQNRTCWNAWNTNFTGYLDIHQDISGLPNGYYSITCDAITQDGCLSDQHAYVASSAETVNSPVMTIDNGWNDADVTASIWEAMSTAATKNVLVSDGKLSIGFRGTHDASKMEGTAADGRNGWFCVTNFKLQYYGTATLEDLTAAYTAKIAECQAQCDSMVFKGDKSTYQTVIDASKGATTEETINAALEALASAQDSAEVSIFNQEEVLNGSYKAIQDSIAAGVYTDATLNSIMQSAVDNATAIINAEGQTKACRDDVINSLRDYRYGYADEYNKALAAIATYVNQSSIDCVKSTLDSQVGAMKGSLMPVADVDAFVAQIEKALSDAAANEIMQKGGSEYTDMIANPNCDGTDVKAVPSGWTIGMAGSGNAYYQNVSQQYDGDAAGYYLDAWNATAGALLYNAHQTIENLPNGTYTLKAMCRTSAEPGAEGTYLYTIADNDSVNGVKLTMVEREQCNITEYTQGNISSTAGGDSIAYVADTYGTIWKAAADATSYGNDGSEEDMAIYATHGNIGYGWHYVEVQAEVKDHTLTIGFTNDSTFTQRYGGIPFTGTWISADTFTLTQIAEGDNSGWSPVTGIASVTGGDDKLAIEVVNGKIVCNQPCTVYSLNGQQMNVKTTLARGIYLVKSGSQVVKVMVK